MDTEENTILAPLTNPDVGKSAVKAKRKTKSRTAIAGKDLTADIAVRTQASGLSRRYRYWVGITSSCPVEWIDLAGINFPKINEKIVPDPLRTGKKRRSPVAGALVWLTEDKIRLMRERLPRTVIRFLDDKGVQEEPGTGENIGDVAQRPRRGQVITIPTEEDLADRRKRGKPARVYVPDPTRDVPASRFMFAHLCEDQDRPERGDHYPDTLETTGLEWPDELDLDAK